MSEIEHFMPLLVQREEEGALAPLLSHGRVHFLWIKHSNLYCIQPQVGSLAAAQTQKGWAEDSSCTAHQWELRLGDGWVDSGAVVGDRVGESGSVLRSSPSRMAPFP